MKKNFRITLLIISIFFLQGCDFSTITEIFTSDSSSTVTSYSDIKIISPDLSKPLTNPLEIKGEIEASYFFEAAFPIILKDVNGNIIAYTMGHTESEMKPGLLPFTATIEFDPKKLKTQNGILVFENDNPSGLPENSKSRTFEVKFNTTLDSE